MSGPFWEGNSPILIGFGSRTTRPFHGGSDTANAHVRSVIVVSPQPCRGLFLCLLYRFKGVLSQPFATNYAIIALDVGILLWLAMLNLFDVNAPFLRPGHQLTADVLRAIVQTYRRRLAALFQDPVQAAYNTLFRP